MKRHGSWHGSRNIRECRHSILKVSRKGIGVLSLGSEEGNVSPPLLVKTREWLPTDVGNRL